MAAMVILNPNFKRIASKADLKPDAVTTPPKKETPADGNFRANTKRLKGKGSFIKGWRS